MISKDQWKEIQEKLKSSFATMRFIVDEHTISVERRSISENKTALGVYVDGKIEFKYMFDSNEARPVIITKVWRRRTKAIHTASEKSKLIKSFGMRKAKEYFPNIDAVMELYDPMFNTAASLVRQFKKIEGIELVDDFSKEVTRVGAA